MFSVFSSRGATPFFLAVFLNAVIDLGHKITLQNTIFKIYDGAEQVALTAIVNALILLPYILFFLPVGTLANRTPKPTIMRYAAAVTVALTALLLAFYSLGWFWCAFATTFLMSTQSAFYSPAKLGYLKILFGVDKILAANGLAQSVVIIGILISTVLFSLGFEWIYSTNNSFPVDSVHLLSAKQGLISIMWPLVVVLIALSLLQVWMVYRIPVISEAPTEHAVEKPASKSFVSGELAGNKLVSGKPATSQLPGETKKIRLSTVLSVAVFRTPILGLALFWALGQGVLAIFPAFAKSQAHITNTAAIQSILACAGIGIFIGSSLVARLNTGKPGEGLGMAIVGMFLMIAGLFTLPLFHLPAVYALQFLLIGIASGMLIVPLNAYLQIKASNNEIGSVIATSNLMQNIAMICMLSMTISIALFNVSPAVLLIVSACLASLSAVFIVPAIFRLQRKH